VPELHGATRFAMLMCVPGALAEHITATRRNVGARNQGLPLVIAVATMAVSDRCVYQLVDPQMRDWTASSQLAVGLVLLVLLSVEVRAGRVAHIARPRAAQLDSRTDPGT
jgi:hypothetical protein